MKNLLILLTLLLLISCSQDEDCVKIEEYQWRWNILSTPERMCSGFDNLQDADVIIINVMSDSGEIYNFTEYMMKDDMIILTAPVEFQTEDFDDPDLMRLTIKLIYYSK